MKTKNNLAIPTIIAVTVAVSILVAFSATASATVTTWYVDDDNCPGPGLGTLTAPYCKIQDAIDNAYAGDSIYVSSGMYFESLTISKSISLFGENSSNTILVGGSNKPGISIAANDVEVQGFQVTLSSNGIIMMHSNRCAITNQ